MTTAPDPNPGPIVAAAQDAAARQEALARIEAAGGTVAGDGVVDFQTRGAVEAPKPFRVDGELYLCAPALPGHIMENVSEYAEAQGQRRMKLIGEFLEAVLLPESAARYAERMRSAVEPITIEEAAAHVMHLLREVYGVTRPSATPSSSPAG